MTPKHTHTPPDKGGLIQGRTHTPLPHLHLLLVSVVHVGLSREDDLSGELLADLEGVRGVGHLPDETRQERGRHEYETAPHDQQIAYTGRAGREGEKEGGREGATLCCVRRGKESTQ